MFSSIKRTIIYFTCIAVGVGASYLLVTHQSRWIAGLLFLSAIIGVFKTVTPLKAYSRDTWFYYDE